VRDADPARRVDQNQARGRSEPPLEPGKRVLRHPRRVEPVPDELEGAAHEADADDRLAGPGGRSGAEPVVGVGAGADHRGVADPAATLPGDAAGRGRGRDVAGAVAGHGPHGLARRRPALAPAAARLLGHQGLGRAAREPVALGERGGGLAHEQYFRALGEHRAREPDRVRDAGDCAHRPGGEHLARHDRGIHLERPFHGQHRAETGVEVRVVLEHDDGLDDRLERAPAAREHLPPHLDGPRDAGPARRPLLRPLASRAAVHGDRLHGAQL